MSNLWTFSLQASDATTQGPPSIHVSLPVSPLGKASRRQLALSFLSQSHRMGDSSSAELSATYIPWNSMSSICSLLAITPSSACEWGAPSEVCSLVHMT
jgi:hypothetical protein